MNLAKWLVQSAQTFGSKPALFLGKDCVADYGEFHLSAMAIARWLAKNGANPGDRVAIFMRNQPEYLMVFWGVFYAGCVVVPINAKLHGREASWIIEDADAKICFVSADTGDRLRSANSTVRCVEALGAEWQGCLCLGPEVDIVHRQSDDLAWLFYTSGTTGQPKGVMITHGMLMSMSLCYCTEVDQVTGVDSALYAAPLSHGAGIYNVFHVLHAAQHVFPKTGGFEPVEIFDLAAHFQRVHMFAAPTMVVRMTAAAKASKTRPSGLRTVIYAGGPMYLQDILDAQEKFGDIFVQIYGQGECPMGITVLTRQDISDRSHPQWKSRLGSVGRAQAAVEVQIGDDAGQAVPAGETGEVMVRGLTVMPGYWKNPKATEQTLKDGWLMTGDVGALDQDGYLTLHDRSKDVIITGGSNVYPREVEEVLLRHPGLEEVSVVGRPHPEWGEDIVAFVVGSAAEQELDQLCLENIARFKRPKTYVRLDELPKNSYGKVLKTELRKALTVPEK